ncbi:hypothetical protein CFP56_021890 [Quercus suber]|uniref:Uncharacterized protein n=1 Tax=Quercus suber TaxID=58331 RepID=A0AAW0KEA7_QUESU
MENSNNNLFMFYPFHYIAGQVTQHEKPIAHRAFEMKVRFDNIKWRNLAHSPDGYGYGGYLDQFKNLRGANYKL